MAQQKALAPLSNLISLAGKTALITGAAAGSSSAPAAQPAEVGGLIEVRISSDGKPRVTQLEARGGVDLSAYTGVTGAGY